jgi:CRP/FNR family cyclic AMP-dependent transcriptional regulator
MSGHPDPAPVELISGYPLLGQLEADELARVLAFARTERFSAGQVIFRRGEPSQSMMTVISGRIKISVSSSEGKEAVLAILGRGEVLGEMALIDGKERSADATAMESGEALSIHRRDFIPFLERNPASAFGCWESCRIGSGGPARWSRTGRFSICPGSSPRC